MSDQKQEDFDISKYPKWVQKKYAVFVREKAIKNVKKKLTLQHKTISDFSSDELEEIIADEEKEVKSKHGWNTVRALLAVMGLDWLISS